jgi:hypothetical protein
MEDIKRIFETHICQSCFKLNQKPATEFRAVIIQRVKYTPPWSGTQMLITAFSHVMQSTCHLFNTQISHILVTFIPSNLQPFFLLATT